MQTKCAKVFFYVGVKYGPAYTGKNTRQQNGVFIFLIILSKNEAVTNVFGLRREEITTRVMRSS